MVGTGNTDLLPYNEILHMALANFIFREVSRKPPLMSVGTEPVLSTWEIPLKVLFGGDEGKVGQNLPRWFVYVSCCFHYFLEELVM